jgi:hypothetical protein
MKALPMLVFALLVLGATVSNAAEKNVLPEEALAILDKAEHLEVWSLEPIQRNEKDDFHGWKVLGKTSVKNADAGKSLMSTLKKGIAENDGIAAACFNPRHGVRGVVDGKTVDLVICFECYSLQVFVGDKRDSVRTTGSPQPAFDKILRDANVPLPKASEK